MQCGKKYVANGNGDAENSIYSPANAGCPVFHLELERCFQSRFRESTIIVSICCYSEPYPPNCDKLVKISIVKSSYSYIYLIPFDGQWHYNTFFYSSFLDVSGSAVPNIRIQFMSEFSECKSE